MESNLWAQYVAKTTGKKVDPFDVYVDKVFERFMDEYLREPEFDFADDED